MVMAEFWKKLGMGIMVSGMLGVVAPERSVQAEMLTIGAPPSMKAALQEIVPMFEDEYEDKYEDEYEAKYGEDYEDKYGEDYDVTVKIVYGASPTLRRQIENGAPIDLFLAASFEDVKKLHDKNMTLYGGPQPYAQTSLVLVMSSGSYAMPISFNEALPKRGTRIALGHPHASSLGKVTGLALANLDPALKSRGKFFHAKHAEAIVNLIHTGRVDMGIIYRADAINNGQVYIVDENPAGMHVPVQLGQAIVSTCREASLPIAKEFFDYLLSARIQKLMLKYGFASVSSNTLS